MSTEYGFGSPPFDPYLDQENLGAVRSDAQREAGQLAVGSQAIATVGLQRLDKAFGEFGHDRHPARRLPESRFGSNLAKVGTRSSHEIQ
jgi:hypothetical protein